MSGSLGKSQKEGQKDQGELGLQRSLIQAAIADIYLYALPTEPPHDIAAYALTRDHFAHMLTTSNALFTCPSGLQRHF